VTDPAPDAALDLTGGDPAPLDSALADRIEGLAAGFVAGLAAASARSAAFRRGVAAIERLGDREIRATVAIAASFQDRPVRALAGELADSKAIARNSRELHRIAERLAPGGERDERRQADFARAVARGEDRIRGLIRDLDAAREVLDVDNGRINQQERALWTEIQSIREHVALAAAIDARLDALVADVEDGDPVRARALRDEVQYAVRRRRRDLLLQLAVATQGYAALRRIEQGNLELIWLIRAMATTTVSALRTAALAARLVAADSASATDGLAEVAMAWRDVLEAVDKVEERRAAVLEELTRD